MRRSEAATYEPRTCDVPVTFLWRISDVSVFHVRMYGVSTRRMCYVRVTYVWRMKRTCDLSTTYARYTQRSILICGVSVAYPMCFNTDESKMVLFTSSYTHDYHATHAIM